MEQAIKPGPWTPHVLRRYFTGDVFENLPWTLPRFKTFCKRTLLSKATSGMNPNVNSSVAAYFASFAGKGAEVWRPHHPSRTLLILPFSLFNHGYGRRTSLEAALRQNSQRTSRAPCLGVCVWVCVCAISLSCFVPYEKWVDKMDTCKSTAFTISLRQRQR